MVATRNAVPSQRFRRFMFMARYLTYVCVFVCLFVSIRSHLLSVGEPPVYTGRFYLAVLTHRDTERTVQ